MPYKDPEKRREQQRRWTRNNRKKKREWNKNLRKKVIKKLGGKCVYCGCDDYDALEINHKNGGGYKEKKVKYNGSYRSFLYAILNGSRPTDDLEIACKVCNALHCLVELKGLTNKWKVTYNQ